MQEQDVVGDVSRHRHVVSDKQHGPALLGERLDDLHDLLLKFRIERRCRFVKEKRSRLHAESARNRGPLLLSARKLGRVGVALVADADPLKIAPCRIFHVGTVPPEHGYGCLHDVLEDREMSPEIELLEHH